MYKTEEQARDAVSKLKEAGYSESSIFMMAPAKAAKKKAAPAAEGEQAPAPAPVPTPAKPMTPEAFMDAVSAAGPMPKARAITYARGMEKGLALVVVGAPYGYNATAAAILDSCNPVDDGGLPLVSDHNPSPFSDFIGMPCLQQEKESNTSAFGDPLTNPDWTFSSKIGMGLLSSNPAPFSSKFGWKLLSEEKPWEKSFGFPLLSQPKS